MWKKYSILHFKVQDMKLEAPIVKELLASDIMPDIKSDAMYLSNNYLDTVQNICTYYNLYGEDMSDQEFNVCNKVQKYTNKKINRNQKNQMKKKSQNRI